MVSIYVHDDNNIELTINSENISSYNVDEDIVTVVMNDGIIYEIKISEDYIDFTVNSKLYINMYKSDWAFWWWEKPWFGDKWHIDTVIKVPDNHVMED